MYSLHPPKQFAVYAIRFQTVLEITCFYARIRWLIPSRVTLCSSDMKTQNVAQQNKDKTNFLLVCHDGLSHSVEAVVHAEQECEQQQMASSEGHTHREVLYNIFNSADCVQKPGTLVPTTLS